jgi:hypothetical protein
MQNRLHVGFHKDIELPKGGFLLIADEVPDVKRARIFDPFKHAFNPLEGIDYKKARQLADILYTVSPQGENTLTVRNGRRALLEVLMERPQSLDKLPSDFHKTELGKIEAAATVNDMLMSPVLRRVLCNPTNFSFKPNSRIVARINRAELGDFDALVLGLFLMAHFQGQLVVPDLGFYGRDGHVSLIREGRLMGGVHFLDELSPKLRQAALLIKDKVPSGTNAEDAEELARYARLVPRTTGFNDFVASCME